MKTWHIRLVSTRGHGVSQRRALLRYVLSWIWFVPPLALAYGVGMNARDTALGAAIWVMLWATASTIRPDRQFWHDTWAGTQLTSVDTSGSAHQAAA
jgi:uncharacterized RDD family membrane protein YckC